MSAALSSFLVLLAVIVSIPLVLWLVKRVSQLPAGAGHGPLKVAASLTLGPHERVAVVTVGERKLLLGITGQSITLLTELDESVVFPQVGQQRGFDELLSRLQSRKNP
ncbi:MAG: flagellar biosynthetic protein FliO [Lautropia sp.]|nr:flagellar biosynthetic protein FliO [Lautropia sp.]